MPHSLCTTRHVDTSSDSKYKRGMLVKYRCKSDEIRALASRDNTLSQAEIAARLECTRALVWSALSTPGVRGRPRGADQRVTLTVPASTSPAVLARALTDLLKRGPKRSKKRVK